ncbi:MAG: histidinol dehydrogenase [Dehalococcoidia bacterium]
MKIVNGIEDARTILMAERGIVENSASYTKSVEEIIQYVRNDGDEALTNLTQKFEGIPLKSIEVDLSTIKNAKNNISRDLFDSLQLAAQRIRTFHQKCLLQGWSNSREGLGQKIVPIQRVGVYVPGGTASYPSTVLMTAIPAKVAGVEEIIMCTPLSKDGKPDDMVLAAADIAGVDRIFSVGGAQSIAGMAFGTQTIPKVDLICGPGNIYVTLAKKMLFGEVGIDGLYGPTETFLIADSSANPTMCAADLLAQAEHDVLARATMLTNSHQLAQEVSSQIETRLGFMTRGAIASKSIDNRGLIAVLDDIEDAIDLTNQFAPEHLSLVVDDTKMFLDEIKNVGVIFVGEFSHEVLGDYVAGPSHVMPTNGTARFNSGIGIHTFLKFVPIVYFDNEKSRELSASASIIAKAEGLHGHAEAAEIRQEL